MMSPDLVMGLDGGGTKTLVAVADRDGTVLHVRRHPSLDPFAQADWPERLRIVLADMRPWQTRIAGHVLALPCYGEVTRVSRQQQETVKGLVPGPHEVINDVEAAFDGALAGAAGVLLLAGTGSMAWAGDGHRTIRCGGWGDVFGDEGSAYAIGRDALGEVSRVLDGRSSHEGFARGIFQALGIDPEELLDWCDDRPARRTAIAALAQTVDTLAEAGETLAQTLLAQAGDALAAHAEACVRRLDLAPPFCWSHGGSVFLSRTVMARVTDRLGIEPRPPRLPPVGGALLRAARRAGWAVDDMWIERLGRALSDSQRSARAA